MRLSLPFLLLLMGLAACNTAPADDAAERAEGAAVWVDSAWARPADSTRGLDRTAVYFTLTNDTDAPARLIHASAASAGHAAMHQSTMQDGVMRMRPADTVTVAAHATATFAPGGYHVMLTALARPLYPGDRFPLRLALASGDTLAAEVTVRRP